jgi:hypothetical protein
VARPNTPPRTGPLMLSDGLPAPWSTSWTGMASSASAPRLGFAEHFSASARAAGFPSTPPHSPRQPDRPAASTRGDLQQFLPQFGSLPGHSFPTLRIGTLGDRGVVLGPVPTHGSNRHLLPTKPASLGSPAPRSPDLRDWMRDAEHGRFEAQGKFTTYTHLKTIHHYA